MGQDVPSSFIPHPSSFPKGEAWIIANPISGGRWGQQRRREAIRFLRDRLNVGEVRWTQRRGDAERWAREAADRNVELVIGAGGDGTINEIANGLSASRTTLGILPGGSVNVVALELGIPTDPVRAAATLLKGKPDRIYLGHAEFSVPTSHVPRPTSHLPPPTSRLFLFAAGLGFDAHVCHNVNLGLKRWGPRAAYVIEAFRLLVRYRSPRLQVVLDGGAPIECCDVIVSRTRCYAGRFVIAPQASPREPALDVSLFTGRGRWNKIRHVWGILRSHHTQLRDVIYCKAQTVEVSADRLVHLQLDGDPVGAAPARLTVWPHALSVIVPYG